MITVWWKSISIRRSVIVYIMLSMELDTKSSWLHRYLFTYKVLGAITLMTDHRYTCSDYID